MVASRVFLWPETLVLWIAASTLYTGTGRCRARLSVWLLNTYFSLYDSVVSDTIDERLPLYSTLLAAAELL